MDEALRRWNRIDVLVNNAGSFAMLPLAESTVAGISAQYALNVVAPSMLAGAALKSLREHKGTIVNVSSTMGHRPADGMAHYTAAAGRRDRADQGGRGGADSVAAQGRTGRGRHLDRPARRPAYELADRSGAHGRRRLRVDLIPP